LQEVAVEEMPEAGATTQAAEELEGLFTSPRIDARAHSLSPLAVEVQFTLKVIHLN
jgi:hypothetical protein